MTLVVFIFVKINQRHNKSSNIPNIKVKTAIYELLTYGKSSTSSGFVIFAGNSQFDYVQYSLEINGLLLWWPTIHKNGLERLSLCENILIKNGFNDIAVKKDILPETQIFSLQKGQYIILKDGLYAQVGKNIDEIRVLTITLMSNIFGLNDEEQYKITLKLNG